VPDPSQQLPTAQDAPHLKEGEIRVDLIRQMLAQGHYYAALANIEDAQRGTGGNDELTLLEADARRNLDQQQQADALYRKLLSSRKYAVQANHGLGLLYVKTDLDEAIRYLQLAVKDAPTNVDFRSDLGYALMEAGRYTEAQPELATANELAPDDQRTVKNLIILYLLGELREGKDKSKAQKLEDTALRLSMKIQPEETRPEQLRKLRAAAQSIRDEQDARTANAAH
jgi:Flp pilus assembly protein TadD